VVCRLAEIAWHARQRGTPAPASARAGVFASLAIAKSSEFAIMAAITCEGA
jgi:hypothetical protein